MCGVISVLLAYTPHPHLFSEIFLRDFQKFKSKRCPKGTIFSTAKSMIIILLVFVSFVFERTDEHKIEKKFKVLQFISIFAR